MQESPRATQQKNAEVSDDGANNVANNVTEEMWERVPDIVLPSSVHPYKDKTHQRWTIDTPACAASTRLVFGRAELAKGDALKLSDNEGNVVQKLVGTFSNTSSNAVTGHQILLAFDSDKKHRTFGFDVIGVEIVQGPIACAAPSTRLCDIGTVNINPMPPLCECPPPPICATLNDFVVRLINYDGFTARAKGVELDADNSIFNLQQLPNAAIERAKSATADPLQVQLLARSLLASGYFSEAGSSGKVGDITHVFMATFGGTTRSLSWPDDEPTPGALEFANAINIFRQSTACSGTPQVDSSATCASGFSCNDDNECVRTSQPLGPCPEVECLNGTRCTTPEGRDDCYSCCAAMMDPPTTP